MTKKLNTYYIVSIYYNSYNLAEKKAFTSIEEAEDYYQKLKNEIIDTFHYRKNECNGFEFVERELNIELVLNEYKTYESYSNDEIQNYIYEILTNYQANNELNYCSPQIYFNFDNAIYCNSNDFLQIDCKVMKGADYEKDERYYDNSITMRLESNADYYDYDLFQ